MTDRQFLSAKFLATFFLFRKNRENNSLSAKQGVVVDCQTERFYRWTWIYMWWNDHRWSMDFVGSSLVILKFWVFFNILFSFVGNVGDIYVDVGSLKMNKDDEAGEFKPGIAIERDCPVQKTLRDYHGFFFRGTIRICPGLTRAINYGP